MTQFAKETLPISLEEEMRRSYLDYAMSVIVGRALPDARDGLKPVHRRALFAMHELNNDWNRPYKKSARIVGDVIGKYHPHGDQSVYDTIVRMAQDFSMRHMLVDGQGNFGSVDGDNAAAMRYTEIRLAKIAHEMLGDIDKETVDFGPNYDGSEKEPLVLPSRLPNLLINGSGGIAVGMATNIPPHNLNEVVDACLHLLRNPEASIDELMEIIRHPTSRPPASSMASLASRTATAPAVAAWSCVPSATLKTSTRASVSPSSWTSCPTRSTRSPCSSALLSWCTRRKSKASATSRTSRTSPVCAW
jgi:DNA gyrase subunit A